MQQNLLLQSETFDNASWTKTNSTITANQVANPIDGAVTADALVEDGTNGLHVTLQALTPSTGGNVTFSVYLKAANQAFATIQTVNNGNSAVVGVDLTTGVMTTSGVVTSRATSHSNGWWRVSLTQIVNNSSVNAKIYTANSLTTNPTYQGTNGLAAIYMWGAQLVKSNWAGEYVSTTASAVGSGLAPRYLNSPTNLVLQSEDLSNASWIKGTGCTATANTSDVTDPLGANTASKLVYDGSGVAASVRLQQQSVILFTSVNTGLPVVLGVWLRVSSGTRVLQMNGNSANATSGVATFTVTTSWQQFVIPMVCSSANSVFFNILDGPGLNTGFTVYVWGAQLNRGLYLSPYVKTTTAAVNGSFGDRGTKYNGQNLVIQSEAIDDAAWQKVTCSITANTVANPIDGTVTADAIVDTVANTDHRIVSSSSFTVIPGTVYTWSAYLKSAKAGTPVALISIAGAMGGGGCYFNLSTGAKTDALSAGEFSTITSLGNGWYRCSVTAACHAGASTSTIGIAPTNAAGGITYAGDGTASCYVYGAQFVQANWPGDYVATTSAIIGASTPPRNKVNTLQNLALQSESFDNASWSKINSTASADAVANPIDGAVTADALVDNSSNAVHNFNQTITGIPVGSMATLSVYAKANTLSKLGLSLDGGATVSLFDLSAGTVSAAPGAISYIVAVPNQAGWYRCISSQTQGSSSVRVLYLNNGGYTYAGSGQSIYLWGAQFNQGAGLFQYVSTTTAAVGSSTPPRNLIAQNQNLITRSEQFDNAAWSKIHCSVIADQLANPLNAASTADILVDDSTTNIHQLGIFPTFTANTIYTFSVFLKANALGFGQIQINGSNSGIVGVNLTTGLVSVGSGAIVGGSEAWSNGWWRVWVTKAADSATTACAILSAASVTTGSASYAGTSANAIYVWGAQLVQGSRAGAYTLTTSAAVNTGAIRNAA